MPSKTFLPARVFRVSRAALHIVEGLTTTIVVFPFASRALRHRLIRSWSRRLLRIFRVELELSGQLSGHGAKLPERMLIVANHISWLDIFVLHAFQPSRFIAKSDISRWPVLGLLVSNVGTLYVDRTRRRDAARINQRIEEALDAGDVVALFPEGTTTHGRDLLPFHGSLLQPVIAAGGHILPVAIRYEHPDGSHSVAASYVGDESLVESIRKLTRARRTRVRLHLLEPFHTGGLHRRQAADQAHRIIRTALELPAAGSAPGTPDDPRGEPQ